MSSDTGIYENVWIRPREGMSSLRQTNMSSHTTHTTTNHHLSNHDDNNLDSLLEDLQTSVSRPGSSAGHHLVQHQGGVGGGPVTTGYREVSRSVTTHGVNGPSNSTEYHIEYLNPANSTTVVSERSVSPGFDILNSSTDLAPGTKKIAQYKVQSYQYKTVGGQNYQDGSSGSMKENINELDTLLDDLNTAQKTGFAAGNGIISKKSTGLNSSFMEPLETSTPNKGGHVSRSVEKKVFQEHRYGSVGRQSPAREIKHEKVVHESSPLHQRKETYRYETKTTRSGGNMREASPPSPPAIRSSPSPSRPQQQVRSYNYTSATEHDAPRTPSAFRRATSPSHRSPSPAGKSTVKSYNYTSSSTSKYTDTQPPYRSPSPTSRTSSTARAHTYDQNRAPSSPTPQPKHTTVHSYNYSSTSTSKDTRYPAVDPSRTLNYQVSPHQPTVITYKYSSHSTQSTNYPGEDHVPLLPRPFPTSPSPTPEEQRPPKKLDELMASFSDSETHQHSSLRHRDVSSTRYTHQAPQTPQPPKPPTPPSPPVAEPKAIRVNQQNSIEKSNNISGPPVYYPPGVELFSKKEEMMQQSEGGMMKSKAKASYEYESKSKSKVKESSGKAVVPVCLPVCCAMPCVIM
ncbi:serine/arginine repetitive matrix protein 1 [Nilaparvata lugens]|uniref:serine/arginine repetitive matrix protein 1 n=1 Tax=Nilaparvata lugens TaxID=108931 RepID=UPI00193D53BC|nr:serine/arginine repetitive matrix protein 1 [Nilaparvata lugens]